MMRLRVACVVMTLAACQSPSEDCSDGVARLCGPAGLPCRVLADEVVAEESDYAVLNLERPSIALDRECRPHVGYSNIYTDGHAHVAARTNTGTWVDTTLPISGSRVGLARVAGDLAAVVLGGDKSRVLYPLRRSGDGWDVGDPFQPRVFHTGGVVGDDAGHLHIGAVGDEDSFDLSALMHDGRAWTSEVLTTHVSEATQAAVAPDGTVSYVSVQSGSIVWQPEGGPAELVFDSVHAMDLAYRPIQWLALAVGGSSEAPGRYEPRVLFLGARPVAGEAMAHVAVMLATRRDGAWHIDDVETQGDGNQWVRPLALVASAGGEVRGFYFRDQAGESDRALVMFWPTDDGIETVDLLPDIPVRAASAQLGARGEIHLVLDAYTIRYLRVGA